MLTAQDFTRDNRAHTNNMVTFLYVAWLGQKSYALNRILRNNSLKTSTVNPIFFIIIVIIIISIIIIIICNNTKSYLQNTRIYLQNNKTEYLHSLQW